MFEFFAKNLFDVRVLWKYVLVCSYITLWIDYKIIKINTTESMLTTNVIKIQNTQQISVDSSSLNGQSGIPLHQLRCGMHVVLL